MSIKVDNAIIMAAGLSSRFAPLSYEKPKCLTIVKGEVLIERQIQQLKQSGINDITVIVGYMAEKLIYLKEKFDVKIVINKDYFRYNNTSSLVRVLDELKNTYICSSDNYFIQNPFEKYVDRPYYACVYADGVTDEYCVYTDENGLIKSVNIGGANSYYMLGHVFFDEKFSCRFKQILKKEYENKQTKDELWENLYIRYIDKLHLYIKKYDYNFIKEFDSVEDLRLFDEKYIDSSGSEVFANICSVLNCKENDIVNISPIKNGLTNISFKFSVCGEKYVYRHPDNGTDMFINRKSEAESMEIAKKLNIDKTIIHIDAIDGWKISHFIEDARELDYHKKNDVKKAISLIKRLHNSNEKTEFQYDIWNEIYTFLDELKENPRKDYSDIDELKNNMEILKSYMLQDNKTNCICHIDFYSSNILFDKNDDIYLIDWEYSKMSDPSCDIGTFIACSDYTVDEAIDVINEYFDYSASCENIRHFLAHISVSSFYWFLWAIHQESKGKIVDNYMRIWYEYSKIYFEYSIKLYLNIK